MARIDLGKVVGDNATIEVGTTTTLEAGNNATVENVGTETNARLNFGIPKGEDGYTPVKGTDYWTNNDIEEIHNYVNEEISKIDLTPYSQKVDTGNTIELSIDNQNYVMTAKLKNINGDVLNTQTIDLPLEAMVVSGSYDNQTKEVILTLQSGSTIRFSVANLVDGLVSNSDLNVILNDYVTNTLFNETIGNLEELTTEEKNNIVNAINEVANSSSGGGGEGIKTITKNTTMQELPSGIYRVDTTSNITLTLGTGDNSTVSVPAGTIFTWKNALDNLTSASTQYSLLYYLVTSLFLSQLRLFRITINNATSSNPTNGAVVATTISLNDHSNYLTKAGEQEITGKKTFTVLPETSITPTDDTQIANKKYVDDVATGGVGFSAKTYLPTMTGTSMSCSTNQTMLKEYLNSILATIDYDVVSTSGSRQVLVVPAKDDMCFRYENNSPYHSVVVTRVIFNDNSTSNNYIEVRLKASGTYRANGGTRTIPYTTTYVQVYFEPSYYFYISKSDVNNKKINNVYTNAGLTTKGDAKILGTVDYVPEQLYQVLPTNNNVEYTPTDDYNPATKKYVDDAIASAIASLNQ